MNLDMLAARLWQRAMPGSNAVRDWRRLVAASETQLRYWQTLAFV